ncbi:MAG: hypothetical protein LQ340_006499, partial [Diploschistes diacapsis]
MHCPWPVSEWGRFCFYGWSIQDRGKIHEKLGPVFVMVTPYKNVVVVADPAAIGFILGKWRQFRKVPSIDEDWSRHRRLTAPAFNEHMSAPVWDESLKQADGMLQAFLTAGTAGSTTLGKDTQTVALHVLTRIAFGVENTFGEGVGRVEPGYQLSFRESIQLILQRLFLLFVLGKQAPLSPVMPASFQKLGLAVVEYERYVGGLLENERKASNQRTESRNNLMSVLARASDSEKASGRASQSMTDQEIFGNIFIFNIAGHDTTANTLAFAIAMLAAHPEVQDWLGEEITA